MEPHPKVLSLFLFIDAFGWEVSRRNPEFLEGLVAERKKLETILGYSSACDPSIISGLTPSEHRLWSSFYYDPQNCPYKWVRYLKLLPAPLFMRGRVRHHLSKIIKRICGFTGYFQIYSVPFNKLPLFNYAEQKRIWEPGGLPRGQTIFDDMSARDIPHYVHDSGVGDDVRLSRLKTQIKRQRIRFAYCSLGRLDALMHAKGNDHPDIKTLMQWYDTEIRELLQTAEENYEQVNWYLFTDHGMHNITETYDLALDIEALNLEWNQDYVAFYDSTMARIWFLNEQARAPITELLQHHPKGRILPREELEALGVWFEDGQYGDLIFLMNSGIQIVPSFMGLKPCKGMHGFHPSDPDSYASICSNRPLPPDLKKIQQIHQLMLDELGLQAKNANSGDKPLNRNQNERTAPALQA